MATRKELAQECDQYVRGAWRSVSKHSMEIGWYGRILKEQNLFAELGYEDEHAYCKAAGVGRSTWYRMVRIAEAFPHLEPELFFAMSIENAEMLGETPEAVRSDTELLAKAATETAVQFDETLARHTAKRQHRAIKDLPVTWKLRMNRMQRKVIQDKLEQWRQEHGFADEAYALEMLLANSTDRMTLMGCFTETIQRLQRTVEGTKDAARLRQEVNCLIREMQEALTVLIGENVEVEEVA